MIEYYGVVLIHVVDLTYWNTAWMLLFRFKIMAKNHNFLR